MTEKFTDEALGGDNSQHGLSQWEATLQCNVVSHWLNPYPGCPYVRPPQGWDTKAPFVNFSLKNIHVFFFWIKNMINYWNHFPSWQLTRDYNCQIDGLVQERRYSIANALELRLSCTNPSKYGRHVTPHWPRTSLLRSIVMWTASSWDITMMIKRSRDFSELVTNHKTIGKNIYDICQTNVIKAYDYGNLPAKQLAISVNKWRI